MFKALVIDKTDDQYQARVTTLDETALPEADTCINVHYSTLNYKDALAITGKGPVVRRFPMVPGIDLAGTVTQCDNQDFQPGDPVLLNGFGVGEVHWGGLAQKARLNSAWLIPLPAGMSPAQAMSIGTAGYTAMLSVMALEQHGVTTDSGEILVTGANGGVGSYAIRILAKLGYTVVASTGRPAEADYLMALGATSIIDRQILSEAGKPFQKERWAGAIDSVGSHTLANVLASTRYGGTVAACGLAQGADLATSVMPFILRGVTLAGIDSVMRPKADRLHAWERLATLLAPSDFDQIATTIALEQVEATAADLLAGKVRGRVIVDLQR